jgi:anaerobic dimethyl sulfoxide reductase subunit B (iron-sulfur subunit)
MQKCNFCQTPGKERPLHMPRACEEICPTGAIRSGPMTELARIGRENAARRLGNAGMQGLPGLIVDAAAQFGLGGDD